MYTRSSFNKKKVLVISVGKRFDYYLSIRNKKIKVNYKRGIFIMKIVGIAACTSGIAHTYIAKEKLLKAAAALGHEIHIETQGTIGTEDELREGDIKAADVVIIAADINVGGKERFEGKRTVNVPTHVVIKSPTALLNKIESELGLVK